MPASTKVTQEIYGWVDDSGTKHFSNVSKPETNTSAPPETSTSFPQQSQKLERPIGQAIHPQIVTPALQPLIVNPLTSADSKKGNGSGFLVFMVVMVIVLKVLLNNSEKKLRKRKRYEKIRELRPEVTPLPSQKTVDIELAETIESGRGPLSSAPSWTLDFIKSLEWREFEKLCATVLETRGFHAKLGDVGPDGGTDIHIYKLEDLEKLYAIAQCKAQRKKIKVDTVRAFRWVMTSKNVTKGFFFTSGSFYKIAGDFGKEQGIEIVTGDDLLEEIIRLPLEIQEVMLKEIVSTDYTTPTCVNCGVKMTKRLTPKRKDQFWGCVNFPRCRNIMEFRWTDKRDEHPLKSIARRSVSRWL